MRSTRVATKPKRRLEVLVSPDLDHRTKVLLAHVERVGQLFECGLLEKIPKKGGAGTVPAWPAVFRPSDQEVDRLLRVECPCSRSAVARPLGDLQLTFALGWLLSVALPPFVVGCSEAEAVKACVTPALPRRRSRYPSASGQVLRKPRGRKPRRTPRWSLSAASMAIEWRWGCDPAACGASSRPRR